MYAKLPYCFTRLNEFFPDMLIGQTEYLENCQFGQCGISVLVLPCLRSNYQTRMPGSIGLFLLKCLCACFIIMCKIISLSIIRNCIRLQKEGKKCLVNARFHSHWKEIEILGWLLSGVFFKVESLLKVLLIVVLS